jgi:hypothetical protein
MSGTGEASTDFAGETREFRIRLGEIRHIEQKCEVGIGEVCRRLAKAAYVTSKFGGLEALAMGVEIHAEDVRAPIYEGLVGGGMRPADATKIVRQEIDDRGVRGLLDNVAVALVVLLGSQETPPGEPQAGEPPATPPSEPTSPTSTASAES